MKKIYLFLITLIFFAPATQAQAAPPKYGQACKKIGTEQTYKHITYKCLKINKKLIWTKKQFVPFVTNQTNIFVPKTETLTTVSIIYPKIPRSFEDLNKNLEGVVYGSWLSALEKIKKSDVHLNNVLLFIGENTKTGHKDPKFVYGQVSKLYSDFPQVQNLYSIHLSAKDINWAQSVYDKYQDGYSWNGPTVAVDTCPTVSCEMGNAYRTKNGDGILVIGESENWNNTGMPAYSTSSGEVYAHEYTHTVQMLNSNNQYWLAPKWLFEGQAHWSQKTSIYSNYDEYLKHRKVDLLNLYNEKNKYTEEYIYNYLDSNSLDSFPRWDAYSIGFMVNEILSCLNGPNGVMNLFKSIGQGITFEEAFNKEFNISWSKALPYISKSIYQELSS